MFSFVYFDLGGVVELDFSKTDKWEKLKNDLGITAEIDEEFEAIWGKLEGEVCVGRDVEDLTLILKDKFGITLPRGYSVLIDGFVNLFEVNRSIWPVLDEIRKDCHVGLLTNMYPGMYDAIKARGILPDIE